MKYISRTTREVFFYSELCHLLETHFLLGSIYGEWEPVIHLDPPAAIEGHHVIMGPIVLDEATDTFTQIYLQEPNTVEPVRIPAVIDAFQGKAALIQVGLYDQVVAFINSEATPEIYRVAWTTAKTWERNSAFVIDMLQLMGKTAEEGDQLFILAGQISLDAMLAQST